MVSEEELDRAAARAVAALAFSGSLADGARAHSAAFHALTRSLTSVEAPQPSGPESTSNAIDRAAAKSSIYDSRTLAAPSLKRVKEAVPKTLGMGWFDLRPLELDESVKRDLKVIQMRNYLDPKRFYKNPDKPGTVLHIGTVIEGPAEYHHRLTRKERRQTITEEVLADAGIRAYTRRKYQEIQASRQRKVKLYRSSRKPLRKGKKNLKS